MLADFEKKDRPTDDPIKLISQGQTFKSNVNGVSVNFNKHIILHDLRRVNISLPEKAGKVLKRIDGNHRISAFEALLDVGRLNHNPVSFCIILLPQGQATRNEKALFYNINSKALALTSEEVYKGIIEDEAGFPEDVLKSDFGPEFVLCRQIRKKLNFEYLPCLCCVFGQHKDGIDNRCSVLIESLRDIQRERQRLGNTSPLPDVQKLLTAIQAINTIYADGLLTSSTSQGLFSAFLYFQLQESSLKRQFIQWVLKNHLYELKTIHASDLIRIFEKVAQSQKRQIFVSMQFAPNTKPNYEAIKGAVDDLNAIHKLDIKLREIRIDQFDTGFSYEINAEILSLIEESGFLIADLTAGNKNVYHEIGFLMGLNQGRGIPHKNFLLLHNGSIGNAANDVGFNLKDFKQLRVNDTNSLREEVKKQIAIYFGLES